MRVGAPPKPPLGDVLREVSTNVVALVPTGKVRPMVVAGTPGTVVGGGALVVGATVLLAGAAVEVEGAAAPDGRSSSLPPERATPTATNPSTATSDAGADRDRRPPTAPLGVTARGARGGHARAR